MRVRDLMLMAAIAALGMGSLPASAQQQMTTIDPNTAIDSDINTPPPAQDPYAAPAQQQQQDVPAPPPQDPYPQQQGPAGQQPPSAGPTGSARAQATTYQRDELVGAAEGVFGKGASGLGKLIEDILKDQGQPNGYIAGSEASGAIGVGLRYGSGMLFHKVEGQRKVYWTGPSIGFDLGGDANKVFVLVYNLYDSQDLYKRFPQGEGRAYFVGGLSASYLRRGDVVLIPVRLGVGWRLGVNAGYMKFSEKKRWLPF
ncbi:hypothetical protein J2W22_000329 [Sphingomonas kyeonggiensis]|uniref:DUF1134 domain-containing protein n=1 Tax=Sphingomonas kyeonggiensis TaxID=1268553 RepID=UPI00277E7692|nr:DUF1134 domain-containing protein [Sphingomonas kyeonggiensis]MDQ0248282.1 hypothetical protein [Sphingomonas kyeonggiensis]